MDTYLLKAAVLYALSSTSRTSTALDDFLLIAPFASPDLDPLAYELFDLRAPLERLGDADLAVPRPLRRPVLAVVRASGDALARIDTLVEDCTAEESCAVRWNAVRPKVRELRAGLCTCRRALQLALEVINLAAAKDDGTDMDTFATYLDRDTSRVLALIRRTLQHVQEEDQTDDLHRSLKSALDEIRLLVQDMCKHRDESKLAALQMAASRGSSNAQSQSHDTSTLLSEPEEVIDHEAEKEAPALLISGLRPAKKLSGAFAKWSLAGASRKSKLSSLSSTSNSLSRASSTAATTAAGVETTEDEVSFVNINNAVPTSRQISRRSGSSHASSSSSRAAGPRTPLGQSGASYEIPPPILPPRNPRRSSMLASADEGFHGGGLLLPSPPTPSLEIPNLAVGPAGLFDWVSVAGSLPSPSSERSPASPGGVGAPLPLFAISPADKIVIDPADIPASWNQPGPEVSPLRVRLSQTHLLSSSTTTSSSSSARSDKGEGHHASTVFFVDTSPAAYVLASKHGDKTIRVHGLPQGDLQASLRINSYVQMRDRSRDFFVTSHAVLSETRRLLAAAARFGDTLEVWDWARRRRVQALGGVYRWAVAKGRDVYESPFSPLACYREAEDAICLYSVVAEQQQQQQQQLLSDGGMTRGRGRRKKKPPPPFGDDPTTVISLRDAGLPCVPKLPELAYSSTAPLLVAAAGPRSPRPGHPPPEHAAMLMAWDLASAADGSPGGAPSSSPPPRPHHHHHHRPSYFCMPAQHEELATALPCGLAAHGDHAVSIWIPHGVRVMGAPGAWQVEPAPVASRFVLVWDMVAGTTGVFPIPNEDTVACVSPDCRYVAYRRGPGGGRAAALAILDALDGGRELWSTLTLHPGRVVEADDQFVEPMRISSLSFSPDGSLLMVGDTSGSVGMYHVIPVERERERRRVDVIAR